jgi:glutathione S-transferase
MAVVERPSRGKNLTGRKGWPERDIEAAWRYDRLSALSAVEEKMLLIGVNRSPFTRRVAITLKIYGISFDQRSLSGFGNRDDVRASNPLGRIPALVLDNGETLIDSGAIIDHLDEVVGRDRALTPAAGPDRRAVLKVTALMMGACEKGLQAAYERNHHPAEKLHQPWIDDCLEQMSHALSAVDALIDPGSPHILLQRLTQADVTAFVAERLAKQIGIDTSARTPRLHQLALQLAEQDSFRSTEP